MIQTLRKPKSRIPLRRERIDPSRESLNSLVALDIQEMPQRDPATLVASLREVTELAYRAIKTGEGHASLCRLRERIKGLEHGFRDIGLHELARFADRLGRKLEAEGQ